MPKRVAVFAGYKTLQHPTRPLFIYLYRLGFNPATHLYSAQALVQDINGPYRRIHTITFYFTPQQLWELFRRHLLVHYEFL